MTLNYTPIDDLIHQTVADDDSVDIDDIEVVSVPKEAGSFTESMTSASKEATAPAVVENVQVSLNEAVEQQEVEPEVKPFVEVKPQNIQIEPELKKAGLQAIEKTKYADIKHVALPLADDKIVQGLHAPITSSIRWLATLAMYMLQQSHLTLKMVGGKAVRIVKK